MFSSSMQKKNETPSFRLIITAAFTKRFQCDASSFLLINAEAESMLESLQHSRSDSNVTPLHFSSSMQKHLRRHSIGLKIFIQCPIGVMNTIPVGR
jgi:hypothetical protein